MALYKKTLIVGATSGIGEALALKLAQNGTRVIATGRREERLAALQAKAPKDAIATAAVDITDLASIAGFVARVTAAHPDIDSVVLNSGIQRAFDFGQPATVDLAALGTELTTNYLAHVHLVTALLPALQAASQRGPAYLVFVGATIGLVPSLVSTPNYNASKAALHSFVTTLRQQQLDAGFDGLRVVEVFPPAVQTELHDEKHQPQLVNGGQLGMPLDAFIDTTYQQLQADPRISIGVGPVEALLAEGGLEDQRQKLFQKQHPILTASVGKFRKKQ